MVSLRSPYLAEVLMTWRLSEVELISGSYNMLGGAAIPSYYSMYTRQVGELLLETAFIPSLNNYVYYTFYKHEIQIAAYRFMTHA